MKKFARAAINVAPNKEREETARGTWHARFLPSTFHHLRRLDNNKFPTRASPLSFQISFRRSSSPPIVRVISRNSDRSEGQGDDGGTRFFIYECALCIPVFFGLTENPGPGWMSVGARFRRKPALDGPARFLFAIRRRVYASYVTRMLVRRAPLVERSAISGFWPLTTSSVAYPWPFGPRGPRILSLVRDNSKHSIEGFLVRAQLTNWFMNKLAGR